MVRQVLRRGVPMVGLVCVLSLAPLTAYADNNSDNQAALDALKAEKAWLNNMTPMDQGVALGQMEIANAKAIALLLPMSPHAQAEIPNTMQQYAMFCDAAIQHVQAQVANATAMAGARPWDSHAQAEMANANATARALWDTIGNTYPGNPYIVPGQVVAPLAVPVVADDEPQMVADDEMVTDDADAAIVADEDAVVAGDSGEATAN